MKKTLSLVMTAVLCVSLLTACSGGGASPQTSADSAGSPAGAGNEKEPVTVTIMSATITESPHGAVEQAYADQFMKENPHIKIEYSGVPSADIYKKVVTLATSGDLPTMWFNNSNFIVPFNDLGILRDLTPYVSQEFLDQLHPGVIRENSLDGKMVLFSTAIQPYGMIYRKDRFEKLGLSEPKTWPEFLECAKALTTDADGDGKVDEWGFSMVGSNNSSGVTRFKFYLYSNGLNLHWQEDGKWVSDVDTPEFAEAFKFWTDLNNVHHVVPDGITEATYDTAANYFAMGITNMMLTGGNAIGIAYEMSPDLKGKIGSFLVPGAYPANHLNSQGYFVSATATEAEAQAACDYLEFYNTHDKTYKYWEMSGKMPTTLEGLKADYLHQGAFDGYLNVLDKAREPDAFEGSNAFNGYLGDAFSAVYSGEATNEQAIETLIGKVNELLAEYN